MKYCSHCGQQLDDDAAFCAKCGCAIEGSNVRTENYAKYDASSGGMWFLGFLLPLVGLICFLVEKDDRPQRANSAGTGALVGFLFSLIVSGVMLALM